MKLSSGKEITFDLMKISMIEFRQLFDRSQPDEDGDELIARCIGMTGAELAGLPYPEYRRVSAEFFKAARDALSNTDDPKA